MNARRTATVAFLLVGLGMLAGLHLERSQHRAEMAELRSSTAEVQRLAARAAVHRLQDAQTRGNELTLQVAERDRQISTLTQEKRDALKKVTSGRACLGTAALRVLDGSPGLRVADLPPATSSVAAADGPIATDSDIGQWSIQAGGQYEQCRKRLGALIQWHRPKGAQR
ncbi:hypothetical protein G8A07_15725 [Roseateles sp. DAIF2]|uniref:hypothetical protein n=1 Tax=Roseateles sp. DAIF2 TaxID=2714952 RepID=UPI0018A24B3D|nr:hypothetical protein [Roseateles sp. DAIF2]QPF74224.1 hypothetical protein G8A07_15725 [Roseateles sp. DAIF2]